MGRKVRGKIADGFSLIEVAIVIAIVGLISGGIVAGQALIKNARLSKLGDSLNSFKGSLNQFIAQYGYPPGDFPRATQVWGRADNGTPITSNCVAPWSDAANTEATCNGDGNGMIGWNSESPRAWQQLRLAGYIQGSYNGVYAWPPTPGTTEPGFKEVNPAASASFSAVHLTPYVGLTVAETTNSIAFHTYATSGSIIGGGPALSPQDAYSIDRKYDDGLPKSGSIRGLVEPYTWSATSCSSGTDYNLGLSGNQCALLMLNTASNK